MKVTIDEILKLKKELETYISEKLLEIDQRGGSNLVIEGINIHKSLTQRREEFQVRLNLSIK